MVTSVKPLDDQKRRLLALRSVAESVKDRASYLIRGIERSISSDPRLAKTEQMISQLVPTTFSISDDVPLLWDRIGSEVPKKSLLDLAGGVCATGWSTLDPVSRQDRFQFFCESNPLETICRSLTTSSKQSEKRIVPDLPICEPNQSAVILSLLADYVLLLTRSLAFEVVDDMSAAIDNIDADLAKLRLKSQKVRNEIATQQLLEIVSGRKVKRKRLMV